MLIQKLTTLSYKKTKKPYNTKLNKNLEEKMKLKLKLKKNIILPKFYLRTRTSFFSNSVIHFEKKNCVR